MNVHQLRDHVTSQLGAPAMVPGGSAVPAELFVQLKGVGESFEDAVGLADRLVTGTGAPVVAMFDNAKSQTATFMLADSEWEG